MVNSIIACARIGALYGLAIFLLMACSGGGDREIPPPPDLPPPEFVQSIGRFDLYDNGTALDTQTQLIWATSDFWNLEGRAPINYEEVLRWVTQMNRDFFAGFNGWRIATGAEYQETYRDDLPSLSHSGTPVGYPEAFLEGGGEWYWGEVTQFGSGHVHFALTYSFITGESEDRYTYPSAHGEFRRETTGSVRLVRDGPYED